MTMMMEGIKLDLSHFSNLNESIAAEAIQRQSERTLPFSNPDSKHTDNWRC